MTVRPSLLDLTASASPQALTLAAAAAAPAAGFRPHELLAVDLERFAAGGGQASPPSEPARQARRALALASFAPGRVGQGYAVAAGGVALVPVVGPLGPARYWPWTSYEEVSAGLAAALADPGVTAAVLVVDSPGGYVAGCADCAASVRALAAGSAKPVSAYAQDLAASAAYWLASATGRVTTTQTGLVGSVGALIVHAEASKALADWGFQVNVVRSGPRKAEANFLEPLSEAARAQLQREVDEAAALFVADVATSRALSEAAVRATQAACLTATQALEAGFCDAIESPAAALAVACPTQPAASGRSGAAAGDPKRQQARPARRAAAVLARARPQPRSEAVDEEEEAARRDEIAAIVAEEAPDQAAAAAQYREVVAVVNRPAPEAEPAEDAAPGGGEQAALAAARAEDARALALPEARGREPVVLQLRAKGLSAAEIQTTLRALGAKAGGFAAARQAAAGQRLTPAPSDAQPAETSVSDRILAARGKARGVKAKA